MKKQYSKMSVEFQPMRLDTSVSSGCTIQMQFNTNVYSAGNDSCAYWYDPFSKVNNWVNRAVCESEYICTNAVTAADYIFQS